MSISAVIILLSTLCRVGKADWQFLCPDLSPPKLNITVPATPGAVESGYIFITPNPGFDDDNEHYGPQQPGAYIFRDDGDLVWSGVGYFAGWFANFRPGEWTRTYSYGKQQQQQQVLWAFEGQLDARHGRMYGKHMILNERYETIKTVGTASHRLASCHEFNVLDGGESVLIETPVAIPADLSPWGGDEGQNWIVSKLDIETGELLFEWYSFDHVDPKYSLFPLSPEGPFNGRDSTNAWNYFHINSVDKDPDGNYLISARNYAAIFKINGTTGDIIWQLGGGHGSNFTVPADVRFAFQHDARLLSRSEDGTIERISFFDNAAGVGSELRISPFSRARIVELNHSDGTVTEVRTFPAPDGLSAGSQGNAQVLPNGNVFVNWGQAGAVTEFDGDDGTVLFHAYLDSEPGGKLVQSYRGFRFNWTGRPSEEPAKPLSRSGKEPKEGG